MTMINCVRRLSVVLAASTFVAFAGAAGAQEISESHLKAARAAVDAINATDMYDPILAQEALKLKVNLIDQNPDIEALITQTVDEEALKLAGRRAALEKEAAMIYAKAMTEEELNGIASFYNSPAGQKLLAQGPLIARDVVSAAEIWMNGLARDLSVAVAEKVNEIVASQAPAPTDGAQEAPPAEAPPAEGAEAPAQ
jgi:hypothetical protein